MTAMSMNQGILSQMIAQQGLQAPGRIVVLPNGMRVRGGAMSPWASHIIPGARLLRERADGAPADQVAAAAAQIPEAIAGNAAMAGLVSPESVAKNTAGAALAQPSAPPAPQRADAGDAMTPAPKKGKVVQAPAPPPPQAAAPAAKPFSLSPSILKALAGGGGGLPPGATDMVPNIPMPSDGVTPGISTVPAPVPVEAAPLPDVLGGGPTMAGAMPPEIVSADPTLMGGGAGDPLTSPETKTAWDQLMAEREANWTGSPLKDAQAQGFVDANGRVTPAVANSVLGKLAGLPPPAAKPAPPGATVAPPGQSVLQQLSGAIPPPAAKPTAAMELPANPLGADYAAAAALNPQDSMPAPEEPGLLDRAYWDKLMADPIRSSLLMAGITGLVNSWRPGRQGGFAGLADGVNAGMQHYGSQQQLAALKNKQARDDMWKGMGYGLEVRKANQASQDRRAAIEQRAADAEANRELKRDMASIAASGRDGKNPAEVQTAEWLLKNGVAKSANEAWTLLRTAKQNPTDLAGDIYAKMAKDPTNMGKSPQQMAAEAADAARAIMAQFSAGGPSAAAPSAGAPAGAATAPPVPGARQAPDGLWYVPDPARPGKYLRVGA